MDQMTGPGWQLIVDGRRNHNPSPFELSGIHPFTIGGQGNQEVDGVIAAWFDKHHCAAALVRPDHYVYSTVSTPQDWDKISRALQETVLFEATAFQQQ
jgi:3-(3-hydroxy-phenyl)propionate hydroxylase